MTKRYTKLQQAAARELINRKAARTNPLHYAAFIDVPGRPIDEREESESEEFTPIETGLAAHHKLLLKALEEIANTRYGRLMVFMPPGSAKSTYASVVFPSWYLGANPGSKLLLTSYGDILPRRMGRRTRQIIRQPRYNALFGAEVTRDSSAVQQFALTNGSEYLAAGILSGITGNRANGVIIDDPIKGREAAESPTIRNKTYDAYLDDVLTRLMPGGWMVLIQTRWHEDDLAGHLLPEGWKGESGKIRCRDGMTWNVICLQARCETDNDPLGRKCGEYIWPEWFDKDHWPQFEAQPRTWASLFQQLPTPLEGDFFKPVNIQTVDAIPAGNIQWVRGWDFAASSTGDYTVGLKLGKLEDGRLIVADVQRMRYGPDERDAAIKNTAASDGRAVQISIPQDPGQAGKTQILYLTRALFGYRVKSTPETGSKETRAAPVAAQVNVGNLMMLRGAWNNQFVEELRAFPNGANDDQVDALSRAFAEFVDGRRAFNISLT